MEQKTVYHLKAVKGKTLSYTIDGELQNEWQWIKCVGSDDPSNEMENLQLWAQIGKEGKSSGVWGLGFCQVTCEKVFKVENRKETVHPNESALKAEVSKYFIKQDKKTQEAPLSDREKAMKDKLEELTAVVEKLQGEKLGETLKRDIDNLKKELKEKEIEIPRKGKSSDANYKQKLADLLN